MTTRRPNFICQGFTPRKVGFLASFALAVLFMSGVFVTGAFGGNSNSTKAAKSAPSASIWKSGNAKAHTLPRVRLRRYVRSSPPRGNNGIGQEKRGEQDGAPPGLIKNGKGDFNDGPGNRHGV